MTRADAIVIAPAIPGVTCERPTGAFYAFPDVSATFAKLGVTDASGFAQIALERAHVAVVPGNAFGQGTHIRLTFATNDAVIDAGVERLKQMLSE